MEDVMLVLSSDDERSSSGEGPPPKKSRTWLSDSESDFSGDVPEDADDDDECQLSDIFDERNTAPAITSGHADKSGDENPVENDKCTLLPPQQIPEDLVCQEGLQPSSHHDTTQEGLENLVECFSAVMNDSTPYQSTIKLDTVANPIFNNPLDNGQMAREERNTDSNARHEVSEVTSDRPSEFFDCCGAESPFLIQRPATRLNSSAQKVTTELGEQFYGMIGEVRKAVFETFQIQKLHQWQKDMLESHLNDSEGTRNALILAPTSGGKSLVCVIMILRALLLEKKDAILVLPYVAIVTEKVHELKRLTIMLPQICVAEYAGSKGKFPVCKQKTNLRTIYVATPEKATSIWKCLCESGIRRGEIGLVCIDEFHMLGDGSRGAVVEELVVNLLNCLSPSAGILALSATIGNPKTMQIFLGRGNEQGCKVYSISRRPTKIAEHVIVSGVAIPIVRKTEGEHYMDFKNKGPDIIAEDKDASLIDISALKTSEDRITAKLVMESMSRGESVLVFCNTRKLCVETCQMLTSAYQKLQIELKVASHVDNTAYTEEVNHQRDIIIGHLKNESKGMVDPRLLEGIISGISYHSAELHPTERLAVEDAYKRMIIGCICCTSTLAAGVNLPSSRVLIRGPWNGKVFLRGAQYLQMTGRAGRTNLGSSKPDSYIMIQACDVDKMEKLVKNPVENIMSQLMQTASFYQKSKSKQGQNVEEFTGITRIILTALTIGRKTLRFSKLLAAYRLTLLYQQGTHNDPDAMNQYSVLPFLTELKDLLDRNHLHLVTYDKNNPVDFKLVVITDHMLVTTESDDEGHEHEEVKLLSKEDGDNFISALTTALDGKSTDIKDHLMSLSPIATAAAAGLISIGDAEDFVREAETFQDSASLMNPLPFLFLSITEAMSKQLIHDAHFNDDDNDRCTRVISKRLLNNFDTHPDRQFILKIGIDGEMLDAWVYGNPTVRRNKIFNMTLTRLFSALFLKELISNPDQFESLCTAYDFDRARALDISSTLAGRCMNLKSFCESLQRFWWYPPIAKCLIRRLGNACDEELLPLMQLRHVTVERAKAMLKFSLANAQDVAQVVPATLLSDNCPHICKWMAAEIVWDARVLVEQEASLLEAESVDRRKLLH